MDLIDRYLDTVRWLLPRAQRDDIIAELRDELMSQREDRGAELGRPLNRNEQEALLRDYGHPVLVGCAASVLFDGWRLLRPQVGELARA
jgi:hypothetical protein